ncbi:MAG: GNAT family N-acetyltransferase [Ruminococcaceae bacterium]|nr:GNAT family N-acetyltransferase [Oscillospiraceae bacterium]
MLEIVPAYAYKEEVRALFAEYTKMLVEGDPAFQEYLNIQNYDEEIAHLEYKYGEPAGRLYLARWDDAVAGCIGLRRIDEKNCEMKRLYVYPAFRGKHIAEALTTRIIADARAIGYKAMLLDTLPFLQGALRLYKKLGFYEIESYNNSPMDTSIYMKLDL